MNGKRMTRDARKLAVAFWLDLLHAGSIPAISTELDKIENLHDNLYFGSVINHPSRQRKPPGAGGIMGG